MVRAARENRETAEVEVDFVIDSGSLEIG